MNNNVNGMQPILTPNGILRKNKKVKNIGMGVRTPIEASKGGYKDSKCPFTGKISIRGRVLRT